MLTSAVWQPFGREPIPVAYRLAAPSGDTELVLDLDGTRHRFDLIDLGADTVRVRFDGVDYPCAVATHRDGSIWINDATSQSGWVPEPRLPDRTVLAASAAGPVSEVPGTVVAVLISEGDTVAAGQKLVVLEAMKMEHPALAGADGVVQKINVSVGQYVDAQTELVTIGAEGEA
nr:biotin/lipoyl-containing protein [Rhodococcus sp. 14C212]